VKSGSSRERTKIKQKSMRKKRKEIKKNVEQKCKKKNEGKE
jgi:hypothetical protein